MLAQAAARMMQGIAAERLPLWAVFTLALAVVLASIFLGYGFGKRAGQRGPQSVGPIGTAVGAMIGLLAFLLAFTFSIASSQFAARKQLLLDNVNALTTAVRRTDLLPEPLRTESRNLLKRLVDLQVDAVRDPRRLSRAIRETRSVEDSLWSVAAPLAQTDLKSAIGSLYFQSLNTLEEVQTKRIAVSFQIRIPAIVWIGLFLVTAFSMGAVGFQFGIAGRGSVFIQVALALAFAAVVMLIAQLDRTHQGGIELNQQPLLDLQESLNTPAR